MLSSLEEGVTISLSTIHSNTTLALPRGRVPFEITRRKLSARKLQIFVREFVNAEKVVVPRSVRKCMLPGYLRGGKRLRYREVVHDPYWVQAVVAEIYTFKISYDMKACKLGLCPISLAQSVCAFHYMRWGSVYIAERATQDLFNSIKIYSSAIPRIRLFAAFFGLGEFEEKDKQVGNILETEHALSTYLDLIVEVHREIVGTKAWKG